jgi:ribosomal protein S18 acetylase RimI-like enzyme
MSGQIEALYKVQKKDIRETGVVLADAFQHDPFWKKLLGETNIDQKQVFFEGSVRYCLKYGEVYASSPYLEGIAAWVSGDFADMTFLRAIRSGSFKTVTKMPRLALRMKSIFEPLEADRRAQMKGRIYNYLIIIGVAAQLQGRGFGGRLLNALCKESDQMAMPLYLETTTEKNMRMFERAGFRVLHKITLPVINLQQWEMLREPGE